MEKIWEQLYAAAKAVQCERTVSEHVTMGEVAAAIQSESGRIFTGVCVDTACGLGVCAERNALFNMITNGEHRFKRVLAIMSDGKTGAPCGACREFIVQLMPGETDKIEIMLDYESGKTVTLKELTPEWWL